MKTVSVAEARRKLKILLDEVSAGNEVSVVRRGREVARLVPPKREGGRLPALSSFRASIRLAGQAMSRAVVRSRREGRY